MSEPRPVHRRRIAHRPVRCSVGAFLRATKTTIRIALTLLVPLCLAAVVACAGGRLQRDRPQPNAGARVFESYCAGCHIDASGPRGQNPPLDGASWVTGPEQRLIRIILHGVRGPIDVNGETYDLDMPRHGHQLTDAQIAAVASYVRSRFGGIRDPIDPDTVRSIRVADASRTEPWTARELLEER